MARLTARAPAWLLILAIALAVRLAAGFWWQSRMAAGQFYFPDSASYWELGKAIADDQPYAYPTSEFRVFRAPGYPLMLAALFRLLGDDVSVMAARALSALLGTAAVAIVMAWTARLFDRRAALLSGWIVALYPGAVSMSALVLSEAPFCPWMLGQLAMWGLAWRAGTLSRALGCAAAAGGCAALATLVRPSWILFTPLAIGIGLVFVEDRRRQLSLAAVLLTAFAVGMLPWWVRNARVTGHFVVTTLQLGASLYDGLNPSATGASDMRYVDQFAAGHPPPGDDVEYRLNQQLTRAAIDWAMAHPGRVVELAWIKFTRTWNLWPNEPGLRGWPLRLAVMMGYAPLLAAGMAGAVRTSRRGWPYVLAWLPALYFALLHTIFVGSIRYREPAMLALAVLAAGWLSESAPRIEFRPGDTAAPARG